MACPIDQNINKKAKKKLRKYQQLTYEIRERKPGYHAKIIPVIVGCMLGGRAGNKSSGNKREEGDKDLERNAQDCTC